MGIKIPGTAFKGVSSFGSSAPEAGFYAVNVVNIETSPKDKPGTRRFHVQFENGFKMFEFVHLAFDDNGQALAGLTENQTRGRMAGLRTILESLGYTSEDIENAGEINDAWFLAGQNGNRHGYVEFTPGQRGVQGSYSSIDQWITKARYDALVSSGQDIKEKVEVAPAASVAPAAPVPTNGAAAPAAGVALPPPPSAAQNIVS